MSEPSSSPKTHHSSIKIGAQAPLVRALSSRTAGARDWSLFVFFRVLSEAEIALTAKRFALWFNAKDAQARQACWRSLISDLTQPSEMNAGAIGEEAELNGDRDLVTQDARDIPARAFLGWLRTLTSKDRGALRETLARFAKAALSAKANAPSRDSGGILNSIDNLVTGAGGGWKHTRLDLTDLVQSLPKMLRIDAEAYFAALNALGERMSAPGFANIHRVLPSVMTYELMRQAAAAFDPDRHAPPVLRAVEAKKPRATDGLRYDSTAITMAFTWSGLKALNVHPDTLAGFPEAFRQGMAARANRLHDVGASAPEHWDGALGLKEIHGYFSGGFGRHKPAEEAFWRALRHDVRQFNDPVTLRGRKLRLRLGLLFRFIGLEVMHVEIGEDPYRVDNGEKRPLDHRHEHFGYRDGLSQPFADMGLGDTFPGGGAPDREKTWTPVAPGEIFLDARDEDGQDHRSPPNAQLRKGATFLVFRKLEQDVVGFQEFLKRQRPDNIQAQDALGAQIVGRWKNGAPLVSATSSPRATPSEAALNDFRYAADDPLGAKCPLGAHIRRANPRDIGGRGEARRHRILRRGISFGGPLLDEDCPDDGEPRGLLFIAANARIDTQFEVIQADWLNSGEFLGQAGLGRCPLTGAHHGKLEDSFLEAGAPTPIVALPRFVTTRGGDYFFAPGAETLAIIGKTDPLSTRGGLFEPPNPTQPLAKIASGGLGRLGEGSLREAAAQPSDVTRAPLPGGGFVAYVKGHAAVKRVLSGRAVKGSPDEPPSSGQVEFSTAPYREAGLGLTRGAEILVATDAAGPTCPARQRLRAALDEAWTLLDDGLKSRGLDAEKAVYAAAGAHLDAALRRTNAARHIDLVDDLAVPATYGVLRDVLGISGPAWLTELAPSLRFARQHVGALPPEWVAALSGERPSDPGRTTLQIWAVILMADVIGNVQGQQELRALSRQAGAETLGHLDLLLAQARAAKKHPPTTFVEALVANEDKAKARYGGDAEAYYREAAVAMLDLVTALAIIPLTLAAVMGSILKFRIDLATLLPELKSGGLTQLIYEGERLNPVGAVRMRRCENPTLLGGTQIEAKDFVLALIGAANLDPRAFHQPHRFSISKRGQLAGPDRDWKNYLLFGVGEKVCWGRNRVALPVLRSCLRACGRLEGLRRIAGPAGDPQTQIGVTISLPARFTRIAPKAPYRMKQKP